MPPSSVVHGGQYDTQYVTFEYILQAALVADKSLGRLPCAFLYAGRTSPGRPSPGKVEAGEHGGSGRSKRKDPPRVDKKALKRGEHSDFHSGDHVHLGILYIYNYILGCQRGPTAYIGGFGGARRS